MIRCSSTIHRTVYLSRQLELSTGVITYMYVFHVQPLGISESNVVSFLANSALERSLSSVDPRWRDLGREGAIVGVEL